MLFFYSLKKFCVENFCRKISGEKISLILKSQPVTLEHRNTKTQLHINTIKCVGGKRMEERNLVNLTITLSRDERKALKQIALNEDLTVSALIRGWLQDHAKEEANG